MIVTEVALIATVFFRGPKSAGELSVCSVRTEVQVERVARSKPKFLLSVPFRSEGPGGQAMVLVLIDEVSFPRPAPPGTEVTVGRCAVATEAITVQCGP